MKYDDVLDNDIIVEEKSSVEFDFEDFSLVQVDNHWEIQFEDNEGFKSIIVQPQDFEEGVFKFEIDSEEKILEKSDFINIENFCAKNGLQPI